MDQIEQRGKEDFEKEFRINNYITLKLERNLGRKVINIYINDKRFSQCIRLVIEIPVNELEKFDEINSIDEAAELHKKYLFENRIVQGKDAIPVRDFLYNISPEEEFWGHCSNIQAWYESNYDTRLLHSNLSFPLLEELTKIGDPIAEKIFKEEIAKRLLGKPFDGKFLLQEYLKYLNEQEIETIIEEYLNKLTIKKNEIDLDDLRFFTSIDIIQLNSKYSSQFLYVIFNYYHDFKYWNQILWVYKVFPVKFFCIGRKVHAIIGYKKGADLLYEILNDWFLVGNILEAINSYRESKKLKKLTLKAYKRALKDLPENNEILGRISKIRKQILEIKRLRRKLRLNRITYKFRRRFYRKSYKYEINECPW